MIKVSVIMPIYNAEKYLSYAMDSLIDQTLKEIEIICVDDGSTDSTPQLLRDYQKADSRITVLTQKNQYAGVARNVGMAIARGQYLSFLDSDDYFKADMLEKAYKCAEKENADITVFGGKYFRSDIENAYPAPALLKEEYITEESGIKNESPIQHLFTFTTAAPWNKLFRKDFIQKNELQFQETKRANDVFFVKMAFALSKKIGIIHENLIYYRTENPNSLQGSKDEDPVQIITVYGVLQDKLISLGLYEKYKKDFQNMVTANFLYHLAGLKNEESFKTFYMQLKDKWLATFGIPDMKKEDFYNERDYSKCQNIMRFLPFEYIMEEHRGILLQQNAKGWLFPFGQVPKGSSIILYGAGKVGQAYYHQIRSEQFCDIAFWTDRREREYDGCKIYPPASVDWNLGEYIVIAIEKEESAKNIAEYLVRNCGVQKEKIVWRKEQH